MVSAGTSWYKLGPATAASIPSWYHLVPAGTQLVLAGTSWYQLVPAGTQLVPAAGPSWYQLVPAGPSWYQLSQLVVPAGTNPAGKPLYLGESWYPGIRANLGIRANQLAQTP